MFTDAEKAQIAKQKEQGFKILVIGQPLSGRDVTKQTYASCIGLFGPIPTIDLLQKLKVAATLKIIPTFPIDANRNQFVKSALDAGADYLFFMDMDQTFTSDTILKLFEVISDERPIVGGMYFLKKDPYPPVLGRYVEWEEDTKPFEAYYKEKGFVKDDGTPLMSFRPITFYDKTNPFWVDVIGLGCVLMKAEVFKDVPYPWFKYTQDPRPGREHLQMDEVMWICAQWKKLGIPIWIDPRVQCGHITTLEVTDTLFQSCRDYQFAECAKEDPKHFDELSKLFIDVREEQANGQRFEKSCS